MRCGGWRKFRSIPTCVGLTGPAPVASHSSTVHPHVRGAHCADCAAGAGHRGPSPRAWGSPDGRPGRAPARWSIPTCVGLTRSVRAAAQPRPVHPHVRGAHWPRARGSRTTDGPSPRAWGSLPVSVLLVAATRSIPTCVGLTAAFPVAGRKELVHPHVRGAHSGGTGGRSSERGPSPRAWGSPAMVPLAR